MAFSFIFTIIEILELIFILIIGCIKPAEAGTINIEYSNRSVSIEVPSLNVDVIIKGESYENLDFSITLDSFFHTCTWNNKEFSLHGTLGVFNGHELLMKDQVTFIDK